MAKHYPKLSKILAQLLYDQHMNASELARAVNLPTPTVHRLVTGKSTRPYPSSLRPIAEYFSISVEQLLGEEPLPETPVPQGFAISKSVMEVPLIKWENIETSKKPEDTVIVTCDLSKHCFAVYMCDSSMEPHFPQGTLLILDPNRAVHDRSFVLVKLGNSGTYVLRQILIDADYQFLKPLNPELPSAKMRLLENNDKIVASLVEARQVYNRY